VKPEVATGNHNLYFRDVNQSVGPVNAQITVPIGAEMTIVDRELVIHQQHCRNALDIVELFHNEQQRFMR
jgi:hypothetical protein